MKLHKELFISLLLSNIVLWLRIYEQGLQSEMLTSDCFCEEFLQKFEKNMNF